MTAWEEGREAFHLQAQKKRRVLVNCLPQNDEVIPRYRIFLEILPMSLDAILSHAS
jgi:hypothetical protein